MTAIRLRRFLQFFTLILIVSACSSNKKKMNKGKEKVKRSVVPEWVYSPMDICNERNEICASGEGDSLAEADANARKSLASIFETNIKSSFSSFSSSTGEGMDPSMHEYAAETFKQINETVDQALEGVTIKQRADKDKVFFALARLDKRKAAEALRSEIKNVDEKLKQAHALNKRSMLRKMMTLFKLREDLASRYQFLSDRNLKSPVTLADINKIKYGTTAQVKMILLKIKDGSRDVKLSLKNILTQIGHKVVSRNAGRIDIKIKGGLESSKEHFNVNGFVKFTHTLTLTALNKKNEKIGSILKSMTAMGRSKADTYRKVKNKLAKYIEEQISELNID
ncbi:MAG: hypothetical protein ACI9QD_000825 [Thermoproteota archaeon]|jgi:hypothetical protein